MPVNERHFAPPKASLELVEAHGLLDEALDAAHSGLPPEEMRARIRAVYDLGAREAGSLDEQLPTVRLIRTSADPRSEQSYAVHTEEQLLVPYLPDPWAGGIVLEGLPGTDPADPLRIEYGGAA